MEISEDTLLKLHAEIERLRAALKEIVDCWYLEDDSVGTAIIKAENLVGPPTVD